MAFGTLEKCSLHGWPDCTELMADSKGEWFAFVSIVDQVVGFWWMWYGHTPVQVHFIWMQRYSDAIQRPIVVPFIHNHHILLQHDWAHFHTFGPGKHPGSCMSSRHTGHISEWACLGHSGSTFTSVRSSFWHYPATLHNCFRGLDRQSRGHSQQPNQLYVVLVFSPRTPEGSFIVGCLRLTFLLTNKSTLATYWPGIHIAPSKRCFSTIKKSYIQTNCIVISCGSNW